MIEVDLHHRLGDFKLDVAFESAEGLTALFGRSGAGKSMTLALIAGLMRPAQGRVVIDGQVLVDTGLGVFVPKHKRRIGLVFQDSHLFPHLSVRHNLLFGRWFAPRDERHISFDSVVETLGIGHLLARRPALLSGGERQRIAIGRALLSNPKLLLLDEPLAALDMKRKLEILPLIERLRDEFKVPIIYISHSVEEVARLAARVVVLKQGQVRTIGAPENVFGTSSGGTTEGRFARASVITTTIAGRDEAFDLTELDHPAGRIWLAGSAGPDGRQLRLVIHATDVTLSTSPPHDLSVRNMLRGQIASIEADASALAAVEIVLTGGSRITALTTRRAVHELGLAEGDNVFALIKTVALDERTIGG